MFISENWMNRYYIFTPDIDFVDLGYPAKYGKAFSLLRDYDMLEYQIQYYRQLIRKGQLSL